LSLPELLKEENIQTELLMPKEQSGEPIELNKNPEDPAPFPPFLPLHIFDNEEFDCRTPEEWINMGLEGGVRKPCPGVALLPKKDSDANCE
jgi:dynein heavy chain